jgi:hypothetical protein
VSKIVAVKDIGVPVPATAPPATDLIACYFGAAGFKPDQTSSTNRVALPLSSLSITTVTPPAVAGQPAPSAIPYYDFPLSTVLPATFPDGQIDCYFALVDTNGSENDLSPVVSETVDRTVPPALGQPIVLP